ncbi:protein-disulfide reductase [Sarracenia purpurea var. burkii]
MPWLAIPFKEERTRQDLCRIFDIKRIPELVFLGPDSRVISTNGRAIVSLYGPKAFPFDQSRIEELEADLREQGDRMPQQVKDLKHKHILKLDMAKAFVCDFCGEHGRFWAFSCNMCNYDLHLTCIEEPF